MQVNKPVQPGQVPTPDASSGPDKSQNASQTSPPEPKSVKDRIALFEKMSSTSGQTGTGVLDKDTVENLETSIEGISSQRLASKSESLDPPSTLQQAKQEVSIKTEPKSQRIEPKPEQSEPKPELTGDERVYSQIKQTGLPLSERLKALSQLEGNDTDKVSNAFKLLRNQSGSQYKQELNEVSGMYLKLKGKQLETEQRLLGLKTPIPGFAQQLQHIQEMDSHLSKLYTQLGEAMGKGGSQDQIQKLSTEIGNLRKLISRELQKLPKGGERNEHLVEKLIEQRNKALDLKDRQFKLDMFLNLKSLSKAGAEYMASGAFDSLDQTISEKQVGQTIDLIKTKLGSVNGENYLKALRLMGKQEIDNPQTRAQLVHQMFENGLANYNLVQDFITDYARDMEQRPVDTRIFTAPHVKDSEIYQTYRHNIIDHAVKNLGNDVKLREITAQLREAGIDVAKLYRGEELDLREITNLRAVLSGRNSVNSLLNSQERQDYLGQLTQAGFNVELLREPKRTDLALHVFDAFLEAVRTGDMDKLRNGNGMNISPYQERVEGLIEMAQGVRERQLEPSQGLFKLYSDVLSHGQKDDLLTGLTNPTKLSLAALCDQHGKYDQAKIQLLKTAFETNSSEGLKDHPELLELYQKLPGVFGPEQQVLSKLISRIPGTEEDVHKLLNSGDEVGHAKILEVNEPLYARYKKDRSFRDFVELGDDIKRAGVKVKLYPGDNMSDFMDQLGKISKSFYEQYLEIKNQKIDREIKAELTEQLLKLAGWSGESTGKLERFFRNYFIEDLGLKD